MNFARLGYSSALTEYRFGLKTLIRLKTKFVFSNLSFFKFLFQEKNYQKISLRKPKFTPLSIAILLNFLQRRLLLMRFEIERRKTPEGAVTLPDGKIKNQSFVHILVQTVTKKNKKLHSAYLTLA